MDNELSAFIAWLALLKLCPAELSQRQLIDGQILYALLSHIDSTHFPPSALPVLPAADAGNWVIIHGRLKKIFKMVAGYYESVLGQNIDLLEPDLASVAREKEMRGLSILFGLVIALAVQSPKNQVYIEMIQRLDQSVQHTLMTSIQNAINSTKSGSSAPANVQPSAAPSSLAELDAIKKEKAELEANLALQKRNLETLKTRFKTIHAENNELKEKVKLKDEALLKLQEDSKSDVVIKAELSSLKSQVEQAEHRKLELESHVHSQESIISELTRKADELSAKAVDSSKLKDTLDEMTHVTDKLSKAEALIEKYKKRLETGDDSKKQMQALETENQSLIAKHSKLEAEYQKVAGLQSLMDNYKQKVTELERNNTQLLAEKQSMDSRLRETASMLASAEAEKLNELHQVEALQERIKELELMGPGASFGESLGGVTSELGDGQVASLKAQIEELTQKNHQLKSESGEIKVKVILLESQFQDAQSLKSKYEQDYMDAHQKNIALEDKVAKVRAQMNDAPTQKSLEELQTCVSQLEDELSTTREKLRMSESEFNETSTKLQALEQAHSVLAAEKEGLSIALADKEKQVAASIEAQSGVSAEELKKQDESIVALQRALKKAKDHILMQDAKLKERKPAGIDENPYGEAVTSLQTALAEKEDEIRRIRNDFETQLVSYQREQRLLGSAWYDMGMQLQKKQMQITHNHASSSWLEQQRKNILDSPLRRR